jgi:hypothetical protein
VSSKRTDETPGAISRADAEGAFKHNALDDDDVEGHSISRGDGVISRGATLDEGVHKRSAIPDDGDDVEGHRMIRGGEGVRAPFTDDAISRGGDLGESASRRVGPGEGHTSRT